MPMQTGDGMDGYGMLRQTTGTHFKGIVEGVWKHHLNLGMSDSTAITTGRTMVETNAQKFVKDRDGWKRTNPETGGEIGLGAGPVVRF